MRRAGVLVTALGLFVIRLDYNAMRKAIQEGIDILAILAYISNFV